LSIPGGQNKVKPRSGQNQARVALSGWSRRRPRRACQCRR
jgi:hypothetical protein